jgi:hypothetical protein
MHLPCSTVEMGVALGALAGLHLKPLYSDQIQRTSAGYAQAVVMEYLLVDLAKLACSVRQKMHFHLELAPVPGKVDH